MRRRHMTSRNKGTGGVNREKFKKNEGLFAASVLFSVSGSCYCFIAVKGPVNKYNTITSVVFIRQNMY